MVDMKFCRYCDTEDCPVGYGFCHCGCGGKTNIAKVTRVSKNNARDEPLKVIRHHQVFVSSKPTLSGCLYCKEECITGVGYCHCGCGEKTSLATYGSRWHDHQRGKPVKFVVGHARRKPVVKLNSLPAKQCTGCEEIKTLVHYTTQLDGAQGTAAKCRDCISKVNRIKQEAKRRDPEEVRKRRVAVIKSQRYQISIEEVEKMEIEQDFKCAICYLPERRILRGSVCALSIDHCHTSLLVRGLLCSTCNTGLGSFKDNIDFLSNAINYLNRTKES